MCSEKDEWDTRLWREYRSVTRVELMVLEAGRKKKKKKNRPRGDTVSQK